MKFFLLIQKLMTSYICILSATFSTFLSLCSSRYTFKPRTRLFWSCVLQQFMAYRIIIFVGSLDIWSNLTRQSFTFGKWLCLCAKLYLLAWCIWQMGDHLCFLYLCFWNLWTFIWILLKNWSRVFQSMKFEYCKNMCIFL